MRLRYLPFFLTFVVFSANSAPNSEIALPQIQTKEAPPSSTKGFVEKESIQLTPVPGNPSGIRKSVQVFDAANSFGIGILSGVMDKEKETKSAFALHFQRTQYNLDESAQEFGLFLMSNNLIGVDWGFKKFCCFTNFLSAFDSYYKIGAAGIFAPKDQLGNLIDYQRYFIQGSFGFENLFFSRKSLRLETGLRFGYPGFHLFAQLSYAFPD